MGCTPNDKRLRHSSIKQVGFAVEFKAMKQRVEPEAGLPLRIGGGEGSQLFACRMMTHHGAKNVGTTEPWTVMEIGPGRQQILNS